jgi:hypothetical protein
MRVWVTDEGEREAEYRFLISDTLRVRRMAAARGVTSLFPAIRIIHIGDGRDSSVGEISSYKCFRS